MDGVQEKDLNLKMALALRDLLEQQDVAVLMTREDAGGLYDERTSNKKVQDMRRRCELINKEKPACVVSIHQNSYHEVSIHGAQVFYGIEEGSAALANAVQRLLNETVNLENQKAEKSIDPSIYLMKNVTAPAILIECGFLSNENETALLKSADYQQKLAVVIATGLLRPAQ